MLKFFSNNDGQKLHYHELIGQRRKTRAFSCGYYERFDPFMLEKKTFLASIYKNIFEEWFSTVAESVLDLGCGTGLYWPVLQKYAKKITGVDSSMEMLREADRLVKKMKWENVNLVHYDGARLDFPSQTFDAVLCLDVFHHIHEIEKILSQLYTVLKPNGKIFIMEPNVLNPLIFIAHLIPAEERWAIIRSFSPCLKKLISPYFENIQIKYDFLVMSSNSERQQRWINLLGRVSTRIFPPFKYLGFRQRLSGSRRNSMG